MGPVSRPAPLSAPSPRGFGRGPSSVSARRHRVVRHGEVEPEQADDGADQPFGLPVRQPEHGLERQRRQDRQVGILGLPAPARAPLGLPRLDRLVRKPDRHAAAPAQALVVLAPVRDLALLLRDVVASVLVQLEGQGGHPGSDEGPPCYLDRAPGATRGIPATTWTAWLFDVLPRALGLDQPTLHNSEGDEVVFHEVTFPLTPTASPEAVALRLDELQELRRESPTFWNWLSEAAVPRPAAESENALLWNVTMEDGSVVLGNIELKERTLVLSVNSAARAEQGRSMLQDALGELVGAPLTKIETVEQMMAARGDDRPSSALDLPPEVQTQVVHAMLDKHCRALIDEPISMLGDISPRAASRSTKGREKIAVWLKHLENRYRHADGRSGPMATYDFTWLWRELKVEHLRN